MLGLTINFQKSLLVGINDVESWLVVAYVVLNCEIGKTQLNYFGFWVGVQSSRSLFSIKRVYHLFNQEEHVDPMAFKDLIWSKLVPVKVSLNHRITINDNLNMKGVVTWDFLLCSIGCGKEKNIHCMFFLLQLFLSSQVVGHYL